MYKNYDLPFGVKGANNYLIDNGMFDLLKI